MLQAWNPGGLVRPGKFFTPTCVCTTVGASALVSIGLVTFKLWFDFESHRGSFASNLEQIANLLCPQVNSASYPQWDGK